MMHYRNLVIVGDSQFAEVAYEYFTDDSRFDVVGFAVEAEFQERDELFGLPVVPLETMDGSFPAVETDVYVAIVYSQMSRLRRRLLNDVVRRGYAPAGLSDVSAPGTY